MARIFDIALVAAALSTAALAGLGPAAAEDTCTCRAPGGKRVELGGTICLQTPAGPRVARCIIDVNILSWQALDTPCAVSTAPSSAPAHRLAVLARFTPAPPL